MDDSSGGALFVEVLFVATNNGVPWEKRRSDMVVLVRLAKNGVEQKAHEQQFIATEDALNKAAEARSACQKLLKSLYGSADFDPAHLVGVGVTSKTISSLSQHELDVWAKEREAVGLKASLTTLIYEDAAAFWSQQSLATRDYASSTTIPACNVLIDVSNNVKDLIDKEVSAFYKSPDNSLYSSIHALLESMSPTGSIELDAVAAVQKNVALFPTRAGARDCLQFLPYDVFIQPFNILLLQYLYKTDSLKRKCICLRSPVFLCWICLGACVFEDLEKAIDLVHIKRNLAESGHALLNHANHAQQEYE
ncbi:hypothetical protein R6Q57_016068, partial [Mikania cordata]